MYLQENIQFYTVVRGPTGEMRSLLYVTSDNFADAATQAERRRRGVVPHTIVALLSPISDLLTSMSSHFR
jgi:hypothetical protein